MVHKLKPGEPQRLNWGMTSSVPRVTVADLSAVVVGGVLECLGGSHPIREVRRVERGVFVLLDTGPDGLRRVLVEASRQHGRG